MTYGLPAPGFTAVRCPVNIFNPSLLEKLPQLPVEISVASEGKI
jgi:hypothetical protein